MGDKSVQIDSESFFAKLQKINKVWQSQNFNEIGSIVMVIGKVKDEPERPNTSDFFLWLLNWEFSDTLLVITQKKTVFAVSAKKAKLLREMTVPASYDGSKLVVIEHNPKVETTQQIIEKVFAELPENEFFSAKCATWMKDKPDSELTRQTIENLGIRGTPLIDMKDFYDQMCKNKTIQEQANQKIASSFTSWTFERIIDEVEDIIEEKKQVRHYQIQKRIEQCLDSEQTMERFCQQKAPNADVSFFDFPLPVLIQSGGDFTIHKFQVDSSQERLQEQSIYINVCSKYCDTASMTSRTLIVDPTDEQKQAYLLAYEAHELLISSLKVGSKISDCYLEAKKFISDRNPNLKMGSNFGFGIGFQFKEDFLVINESNQTVLEDGMTLHVRIALSNVSKEAGKSVVAIGDTVIVQSHGPLVITKEVRKKYCDISYSLEESSAEPTNKAPVKAKPVQAERNQSSNNKAKKQESSSEEDSEENDEVSASGSDQIIKGRTGTTVIKSARLRSKAGEQKEKQNDIESRKEHQLELYTEKQKELKIRFQRGEICASTKKEKVKKMDTLQAFKTMEHYPKDLVPGQIYVDTKRFAVLIPNSPTTFVPFHVSTIKSVSDMIQGQWTFLRINFHTQPSASMQYPPMDDVSALWVKELTMKTKSSSSNNRLSQASKQIKELLKQAKQADTESEVKAQQGEQQLESLQLLKSVRKECLDNLVIRPNLVGKKTQGNLEIHQNGVRFSTQKGEKVDICFSNVKHCFFQPCASDELIVLIHFHLSTPIMLGTKKVVDVQFYKESGVAAEDINFAGGRNKYNDMDELEQEEAERQARKRLNQKFLGFAKILEQASESNKTKLEVDIPEEDLEFYGCPVRSVVRIRPTKQCLIALSEFPFFVLDVLDIEIVCFERVFFGIKNFDCVIVFKDFLTTKRIDSIPIEYLEELKSYFDSIDVIYSECPMPLKWKEVLQSMRDNFQDNLEVGVWRDLVIEGSDDEEEGEADASEDGVCEYDSEEAFQENSSDDFSGDDYSESSDGGAVDAENELSEEGLSWDELDKQAEEEDRKQFARRGQERQQPHKSGGGHSGHHGGHHKQGHAGGRRR